MSMVSAVDCNKVHGALEKHLDTLEQETKVADLKGDMLSLAKKTYERLDSLMHQAEGLNPNLVNLTLNIIKGKFYSPFGIANDLQKWIQHPTTVDSSHYVWYDLCIGNR
jgi:hypothetical protein